MWQHLNERDDARIIHEWHDAVLRETWTKLPIDERAHVDTWRDRTYRNFNPIDLSSAVNAPKPRYIERAADLAKYLRAEAG